MSSAVITFYFVVTFTSVFAEFGSESIVSAQSATFTVDGLPEPVVCGPFLSHRLLGGDKTDITDFPWNVLIKHTTPYGDKGIHCGGAIIHKNYVITAAQCLIGRTITENNWKVTDVILGEWDLTTGQDCDYDSCSDPVQVIPIAEQIPHEHFYQDSKYIENDIALIRLARPVKFSYWIKPICLPVVSSLRDMEYGNDITFTLSGWGQTEVARISNIKLRVELDSVPMNECIEKYQLAGISLNQNHICAGGVDGFGSCKGDLGSPLMKMDLTNRSKPFIFLAGILSYEPKPCGSGKRPTVFTRVDRYSDWILSHMRP